MIDKFADVEVPGKTQKELSREGFKSLVNAIKDGSFDEFMADAVDDNLKVLFSTVDVLLTYLLACLLTCLLTCLLAYLLTCLLNNLLTHFLTYSLTCLLTCLLTRLLT